MHRTTDTAGPQSRVGPFAVASGARYFIAIDGFNGATGTTTLHSVFTRVAPGNDNFAAASILAANPGTATGTTNDATKEPGEPNHASFSGGASVWYVWTAPAGGTLAIDTFGSSFDTLLAVYTGPAVGSLVSVASNDDTGSPGRTVPGHRRGAVRGRHRRLRRGHRDGRPQPDLRAGHNAESAGGTDERDRHGRQRLGHSNVDGAVGHRHESGQRLRGAVRRSGRRDPSHVRLAGDNAVGHRLTNGTTYTFTVAAVNAAGTGTPSAASNSATPGVAGGRYNALTPARILDTRSGVGGFTAPVPVNGSIAVPVTGAGGVPATGVSSVVLNVASVQPSAAGFLTVYPGAVRPPGANVQFATGQTVANLVVTKVGADGKVTVFRGNSSTHVTMIVVGWYS